MFDVIKHISRSLCKTVKVGLYLFIYTFIFAQLVCCRQNDGMTVSKCNVYSHEMRVRELEARKSLVMRMSKNLCYFFHERTQPHIRSPHIQIFYKEFIERKCKKKQIMLEAWSKRMEGFKKKKTKEEATLMVYEKNHIVCGNIFYVYVCMCLWMFVMKMGIHARTYTHDERIWMILFFTRSSHDRKCVWDGKHLLTRYDKLPKYFQFWSTHNFFFVDTCPLHSFIIRFFSALPLLQTLFWHLIFFCLRAFLYLLKPIFYHELTQK